MQAKGDVRIEGQVPAQGEFSVQADRASYEQAKDAFILEGNTRTPAKLWRRTRAGVDSPPTEARKIRYVRSTGEVKVDGIQYFEITPQRSSKRAAADAGEVTVDIAGPSWPGSVRRNNRRKGRRAEPTRMGRLHNSPAFLVESLGDEADGALGHVAGVLEAVAAGFGFQVALERHAERPEFHSQPVGRVVPADSRSGRSRRIGSAAN